MAAAMYRQLMSQESSRAFVVSAERGVGIEGLPVPEIEEDLAAVCLDVERLLSLELDQQGVRLELRAEPMEPQLADGNQLWRDRDCGARQGRRRAGAPRRPVNVHLDKKARQCRALSRG